jgi:hypothetical protein
MQKMQALFKRVPFFSQVGEVKATLPEFSDFSNPCALKVLLRLMSPGARMLPIIVSGSLLLISPETNRGSFLILQVRVGRLHRTSWGWV